MPTLLTMKTTEELGKDDFLKKKKKKIRDTEYAWDYFLRTFPAISSLSWDVLLLFNTVTYILELYILYLRKGQFYL